MQGHGFSDLLRVTQLHVAEQILNPALCVPVLGCVALTQLERQGNHISGSPIRSAHMGVNAGKGYRVKRLGYTLLSFYDFG